ncbi:MAG: sugar phosphate isomerase/epimerase, partial [Acidobacteriaceae bacterium]
MNSRREFLKTGAAALLCGSAFLYGNTLDAEGKGKEYLDLPLGLELYSVREMLPTSYEATLKQIAAIGYREVEAAGFFNRSASQVKEAMQHAGLHCVSAHYSYDDLHSKLDQIVAFGKEVGFDLIVCPGPGRKDASHYRGQPGVFTLADWRWNAEQLNK